ncbi:MAG TPA: hypothetical protein VM490_26890, partial [Armatimonadaceae bacterium]|nr:hypothetical protein [Armatimonadaceae bacterium]
MIFARTNRIRSAASAVATTAVVAGIACAADAPPPKPGSADVRIAWDHRSRQTLGAFSAGGKEFGQRHYPRVRRLRSGDLLLTFMDGRFGWQTFQQRSKDGGRTWDAPRQI